MAGVKCWKCFEVNNAARDSCRACGANLRFEDEAEAPAVDIPPPEPGEKTPTSNQRQSIDVAAHKATRFRDQVTKAVLRDKLVPPFKPPQTSNSTNMMVLLYCVAGIGAILGLIAFAGSVMVALGMLVFAGVMGWFGWFQRASAVRKRDAYTDLHQQAMAMAKRMLAGQDKPGDSQRALRNMANTLLATQEPEPGSSVWVFVWFSGELAGANGCS